MPYTLNAQENEVLITFTDITLAQVQAYLATKQPLLKALRWNITSLSGPGPGPFRAILHRSLTPGDQQALEQALTPPP